MRSAVIDTDVVSFSFKEDTRGSLYEQHLKNGINSISFMTLAELDYWAASHSWGDRRKAELAVFLKQFAVIYSDRYLCQAWADIRQQANRIGRVIQPADAWIAATAWFYQVPLITHNANDFSWISGLTVISEPDK